MQKETFNPINIIKRTRKALTMLEVVFVIVILGIVSAIGSQVIVQVYEQYIVQTAQHRASVKTQLSLNQIINRLRYAVPGTIGRRKTVNDNFEPINTATATVDYDVLQWVARDGDSFEAITSAADRNPGWSGFCDVDGSASATNISTPGSNLALAENIIRNLSNGGKGVNESRLYFAEQSLLNSIPIAAYTSPTTLTLQNNPENQIVERYYLAWSSYALVMKGKQLWLYYDFDPTYAAGVSDTDIHKSALLLNNVTNFKFTGTGATTRLKICIDQNISADATISSCKEKAVF